MKQDERRLGAALGLLTVLLAVPALADPPELPTRVGVYYRIVDGGLVALLDAEIEATVYVRGSQDEDRYVRGEVADEQGRPVLSGDWELFVDEVRLGDVVATRKVEGAGPEAGEAAERVGYARLHP